MYLFVILLILLAIFVIKYVSNNNEIRGVKILPYYLMICIIPIYYIFDHMFFVNMFENTPILSTTPNFINFTANDLRTIVYIMLYFRNYFF